MWQWPHRGSGVAVRLWLRLCVDRSWIWGTSYIKVKSCEPGRRTWRTHSCCSVLVYDSGDVTDALSALSRGLPLRDSFISLFHRLPFISLFSHAVAASSPSDWGSKVTARHVGSWHYYACVCARVCRSVVTQWADYRMTFFLVRSDGRRKKKNIDGSRSSSLSSHPLP